MFSAGSFKGEVVISTTEINRISLQNVDKLKQLFIQTIQEQCNRIVLDLNEIKFIDSKSFEVIDSMNKIAEQHKINLEFANIQDELQEIFDLVPCTKNFRVAADVELIEAINATVVS